MLIYHDPNSIIREAYQKILMGGKYLLESSSSTAKALVLKKLDEEPDYLPKAYRYILKNIPDYKIADIYQQVFGRPMRGRASSGARGQITDELGFNTNGINFLLKYAPTHVINHIGGWFDMELRADADSEETQDTNTQASEKSNNYIVDEIIVKLKDLKLNNNSLYTIYRKILKSVSDKTALYTAARNLYNKKEDYYDIGAVLVKAMQEKRGTFILSDFANILRYLDIEDLKKANSIVDDYIAKRQNGGQQNQGQSQSQTQQTQQQAQQTPQVNGQTNDKPYNINITTADISKAARQVGVKLGAYGDKVFGYKRPMCEPHVGEDIMQKYLTQLFKNVAKVGYAKAREDFVAQLTAKKIRGMEDLMKVADQINANSSKIQRDTEQVKKAYQNGMTPFNTNKQAQNSTSKVAVNTNTNTNTKQQTNTTQGQASNSVNTSNTTTGKQHTNGKQFDDEWAERVGEKLANELDGINWHHYTNNPEYAKFIDNGGHPKDFDWSRYGQSKQWGYNPVLKPKNTSNNTIQTNARQTKTKPTTTRPSKPPTNNRPNRPKNSTNILPSIVVGDDDLI